MLVYHIITPYRPNKSPKETIHNKRNLKHRITIRKKAQSLKIEARALPINPIQ